MHDQNKVVIIIGAFINGFSIYKSLKTIGFKGKIYALNPDGELKRKSLLKVCAPEVIEVNECINSTEKFIEIINNIPGQCKCIFSSSEEVLPYVQEALKTELLQEQIITYPQINANFDIIIDKYKFYTFVEQCTSSHSPITVNGSENPYVHFKKSFIMRPKKSWERGLKTPRVAIVRGKNDLEMLQREYADLGLNCDAWCYQEVLDTDPYSNVSVMGWHSTEESFFFVNRKCERHPEETGSCDVVEIVDENPNNIKEHVKDILKHLEYEGPFEMEFLLDKEDGIYKVIDFNPRYWMQHEMIEKQLNYYMIRKNLGEMDIEVDHSSKGYRYWINSNQLILRLLKGQFRMMKYLHNAVLAPGVFKSLKWIFYILVNKVKVRIHGKGEKE